MLSFVPGNIRFHLESWERYTSDQEILQTVSGLKVEFEDANAPLPLSRVTFLSGAQAPLIRSEIESLILKGVIVKIDHSPGGDFISYFSD